MRHPILIIILLLTVSGSFAQQTQSFNQIPVDVIYESGLERAGSCASPNGTLNCITYTSPPTLSQLNTDGCCYNISPAVKNATYCYTFTAAGTSYTLNSGFAVTGTGAYSYWFDNFNLYTCAPSCTLLPAYALPYFTYSGLTVGNCYTWCFDTHMTGGGPAGGFTKMCPYGLPVTPLPIELENFYGYSNEGINYIHWSTATESNCMLYVLERSADGVHFEELGDVPAQGNTLTTTAYAYTDKQPLDGVSYYRLRSVDFDLSTQYSDIITVTLESTPVVVRYYSLSGQSIQIEDAASGIYVMEIVSGDTAVRQLFYHTH